MVTEKLTKRQAEILNTVLRAGGAAAIVVRDDRGIAPVRALAEKDKLSYRWTGCVVYLVATGARDPFVSSESVGYESDEGPREPAKVRSSRNHLLGYKRAGWAKLAAGENLTTHFGEAVTIDTIGADASSLLGWWMVRFGVAS